MNRDHVGAKYCLIRACCGISQRQIQTFIRSAKHSGFSYWHEVNVLSDEVDKVDSLISTFFGGTFR